MPIIRPIPKRTLIHSIEYQEYLGSGRNGDTFADKVTVNQVLVQPSFQVKRTTFGDERQIQSVVFIDQKNSSPFIELKPKSKVTYEGKDWIVNKCAPLFAFSTTPHHYEVELI